MKFSLVTDWASQDLVIWHLVEKKSKRKRNELVSVCRFVVRYYILAISSTCLELSFIALNVSLYTPSFLNWFTYISHLNLSFGSVAKKREILWQRARIRRTTSHVPLCIVISAS